MRIHQLRAHTLFLGRTTLLLTIVAVSCGRSEPEPGSRRAASAAQFTQLASSLEWPGTPGLDHDALLAHYNERSETVMSVVGDTSRRSIAVLSRLETLPIRMRVDFWSSGFSRGALPTDRSAEMLGPFEVDDAYFGPMVGFDRNVLVILTSDESDLVNLVVFAYRSPDSVGEVLRERASDSDEQAASEIRIRTCEIDGRLHAFTLSGGGSQEWWYARAHSIAKGVRPGVCRP